MSKSSGSHRTRPQKYQNKTAFKNTLHNTNKRSLAINKIQVDGCCAKCKEVIDWKIRYKKYKPLTVPKKCIKCSQKTVKKAYCVVCAPCAEEQQICQKCALKKELVKGAELTEEELHRQQAQLEQELKFLPERKRRTFLRLQAEGKLGEEADAEGKGDSCGADNDSEDSETDDVDSDSDLSVPDTQPTDKDISPKMRAVHFEDNEPNTKDSSLDDDSQKSENIPSESLDIDHLNMNMIS